MKISKKSFGFARAFTLVELMVAIAIIVLLTGIIMTNLVSSKSKSRDAKRISDLGQIQLALELYFDRCKQYPALPPPATPTPNPLNVAAANNCPTGSNITLGSFISKIPTPPSNATFYDYAVNPSGPPTDYVLHVTLENSSEVLKDSLTGSLYGLTCYNGSTNKEYCLGPK
jgi:prepilin-type N-terminal cleavage/methylation domain-containing protein